MKVLAHIVENSGVHYHRLYTPLMKMKREGLIDLRLSAEKRMNISNEDLAWADVFIVSRMLHRERKDCETLLMGCMVHNCKLIVDIDDYWQLPEHHPMFEIYNAHLKRNAELIALSLCYADAVWASTYKLKAKVQWLFDEFERIHKQKPKSDIEICGNAIDSTQPQWKSYKKKTKELTFGYIGGTTHDVDIEMIEGIGDEFNVRAISYYADKLKAKPLPPMSNKKYAKLYEKIDVGLIPLIEGEFESLKSPLKLVEAAHTGCSVIVSDVEPYTGYLRHGENCLAVPPGDDWRHYLRMMTPELHVRLRDQLRKDMAVAFDLEKINQVRLESLKKVLSL